MLVYEVAFGGQNRETGEVYSFETVRERLDNKILEIKEAVGADSYTLYLTGKGNFREEVAVTRKYKGNRLQEKPWHYNNVRVYLESLGAKVIEGMEADDALAIEQVSSKQETVICTRDKDLRQVPGWHYGWEHGMQPEFELQMVDELGTLELVQKAKKKEIKGTGLKFFYSQLITGDTTDNIPGLAGGGAVAAHKLLHECNDEASMFKAVREAYRQRAIKDYPHLGEALDAYVDALILEQGRLLWMVRELDKEGNPVMWELPNG